uniref:Uncharacterized protein n=1 Tax=Pithovirus LCPAC202 TaxID=2506592 RepID=A0A481Z9D8_9VIRU|nr:MAG: hypothetical protein LCPAC202_02750 [Pithovirus LCPAC202]
MDQEKKSVPDGYVLLSINDRPYNEGTEYWFRNNFEELVRVAKNSWDWMQGRETYLASFKYGQRMTIIEGVLPLFDDADEKWGVWDPELYPETINAYEKTYICKRCDRFATEPEKSKESFAKFCDHCKEKGKLELISE